MSPIPDDRLRLIFTTCHPALSAEVHTALAGEYSKPLLATEKAQGLFRKRAVNDRLKLTHF